MKCPTCGASSLHPGATAFAADVDGTAIVIHDVPASICDVCGDAYIDYAVSDELETTTTDAHGRGAENRTQRQADFLGPSRVTLEQSRQAGLDEMITMAEEDDLYRDDVIRTRLRR